MKTKKVFSLIIGLGSIVFSACTQEPVLKEALKNKFYIGAAMNSSQIAGRDTLALEVIKKHFSAIVPENCMKSGHIQPVEGQFSFTQADQFVAFGEANNLFITGHCLVWHSQAPEWFFVDKEGKDVSREVLIQRMKDHITTLVSRYKGRVKGWDVVNEAILENGKWRDSPFYKIIGEDFVRMAFEFAHEADPDAELYYNDYSMAFEDKRNTIVKMVQSLKAQGVRIDGVGMQGHIGMDYPAIEDFEKSLLAFSETGVQVMITELDLSALPTPKSNVGADVALSLEYKREMNPYTEALPDSAERAWTERYNEFYKLFLKHSDKISRVTLWGVNDGSSWRNGWPVPGRTDYPLLFDRNFQPKRIVRLIIEEAK